MDLLSLSFWENAPWGAHFLLPRARASIYHQASNHVPLPTYTATEGQRRLQAEDDTICREPIFTG